jgi:PAS domain-containing protein
MAVPIVEQEERMRTGAHRQLVESEERYRDLVESSRDLICTHDPEGWLLSVNEAVVRMSGLSRTALLKMNMADLLTNGAREQFPADPDAWKSRRPDARSHGEPGIAVARIPQHAAHR